MSLGIVIRNQYGIALGSDSLVSSVSAMVDRQQFVRALKEAAQRSGGLYTDEIVGEALDNAGKQVIRNNHRSSKIYPFYFKGGRPWGAIVETGDARLSRAQMRVVERLGEVKEPLHFRKYIAQVHQGLANQLQEEGLPAQMDANFLYAGRCLEDEALEVHDLTIFVRQEDERQWAMQVRDNSKRDQWLWYAGDSRIVETLLAGRSARSESIIRRQMKEAALHLLQACEIDADSLVASARIKLVRAFQTIAPEVEEGSLVQQLLEQAGEAYDKTNGTLTAGKYLDLLHEGVAAVLGHRLSAGAEVTHFQAMSLRELLKVINFLIETTARVHEYIFDTIPGVGGDIYCATITREEGLMFRNMVDPF